MTPCDGAELSYYRICAKTQVLKNVQCKSMELSDILTHQKTTF